MRKSGVPRVRGGGSGGGGGRGKVEYIEGEEEKEWST